MSLLFISDLIMKSDVTILNLTNAVAQSFKKKTKTRDLVPLYEYAKKHNISEEELSNVIKKVGL